MGTVRQDQFAGRIVGSGIGAARADGERGTAADGYDARARDRNSTVIGKSGALERDAVVGLHRPTGQVLDLALDGAGAVAADGGVDQQHAAAVVGQAAAALEVED